jgi:hypothetical protein
VRKTFTAAVALLAIAAIFVAVAPGGTSSTRQRVRIDVNGTDPYTFDLKPLSRGMLDGDFGSAKFCCWDTWSVTRAGAKVEVSNPRVTFHGGTRGQQHLTVRERVEWTSLPDGWSVFTGTWKVVGGTSVYAGYSGHGRVAGAWAPASDPNRALRLRLTGFLDPNS